MLLTWSFLTCRVLGVKVWTLVAFQNKSRWEEMCEFTAQNTEGIIISYCKLFVWLHHKSKSIRVCFSLCVAAHRSENNTTVSGCEAVSCDSSAMYYGCSENTLLKASMYVCLVSAISGRKVSTAFSVTEIGWGQELCQVCPVSFTCIDGMALA